MHGGRHGVRLLFAAEREKRYRVYLEGTEVLVLLRGQRGALNFGSGTGVEATAQSGIGTEHRENTPENKSGTRIT